MNLILIYIPFTCRVCYFAKIGSRKMTQNNESSHESLIRAADREKRFGSVKRTISLSLKYLNLQILASIFILSLN